MKSINFTPEKLALFKKEYEKAVEEKKEVFVFEEKEIVTSYAKYLIEHLDNTFNQNKGGQHEKRN